MEECGSGGLRESESGGNRCSNWVRMTGWVGDCLFLLSECVTVTVDICDSSSWGNYGLTRRETRSADYLSVKYVAKWGWKRHLISFRRQGSDRM